MPLKLYPESDIQNIASAIRDKNGLSDLYTVGEMAQAIEDIPSGGGGGDPNKIIDVDFTNSNFGRVQGITDNGLNFTNQETYFGLGVRELRRKQTLMPVGSGLPNGFTIEIDVASMNQTATNNRRFIMDSSNAVGFAFHANSGLWGFYSSNWEYTNISDVNYFDNCTVKLYQDSSNHWSIYKDNILVHTTIKTWQNNNDLQLGASSNAITDTLITGYRVYLGQH